MAKAMRLLVFALAGLLVAARNSAVGQPTETPSAADRNVVPPVPPLRVAETAAAWTRQQADLRATLERLLGNFPVRPAVPAVRVLSREDRGSFTVERFEFSNGLGDTVPGVLLLPNRRSRPVPGILYCHWHGGEYDKGKVELFETNHTPQLPGQTLTERGYAVLAIDAACFGERHGRGPDGLKGGAGELSAAKFDLWLGRSLWGRILRDDRMALDYLASRPEVDATRLGAMGMSMGATRTWWLMALDERLKAGVAVACLTRYQELIEADGLKHHGIYYYVPGLLTHFDTEAVVACAAPRALLCLNGDQDAGSPVTGIRQIERLAAPAWEVLGQPGRFKSRVYEGVGHTYTQEMWRETLDWLERQLAKNL